ncbi:hypothetical protein D3C77_487200 [compost metagenome]
MTADLFAFLVGVAVLGLPAALGLAVRHNQYRAADLLAEAGALGDVLDHVVTQLLTFANQAADHQQRDQQQHDQQRDGAKFDTQGSVHGAGLRFRWAESAQSKWSPWEHMWSLCAESVKFHTRRLAGNHKRTRTPSSTLATCNEPPCSCITSSTKFRPSPVLLRPLNGRGSE